MNVHTESIAVTARDSYPLTATYFAPETSPVKAGLLISGGTGFPQRYYRAFAEAAAAQGYGVLTYDYRGIGASAPEDLSSFDMHYTDWGRHDMPAVLDALSARVEGPLFHIGHSVGGHFVGFMDNHEKIAAHQFVCVGSGYWGRHKPYYWPMEMLFWHFIGPTSIKRYGYVKSGRLWQGESLPRGVFEPWRDWSSRKAYFNDMLGESGPLAPATFNNVRTPIRSVVFTDDPIATKRAAEHMLEVYPEADATLETVPPATVSLKSIGHNGPFPRAKSAAWPYLWNWFDQRLERSAS